MKKQIVKMGTTSGRDTDKAALVGVTPKKLNIGMTFEEAESTLVCRKLYSHEFTPENMSDDLKRMYGNSSNIHTMYIGEIIDIL
jgi:flavin reductase (DIM6/NTAB) family NADH-FMN oxidoreductase RutF